MNGVRSPGAVTRGMKNVHIFSCSCHLLVIVEPPTTFDVQIASVDLAVDSYQLMVAKRMSAFNRV